MGPLSGKTGFQSGVAFGGVFGNETTRLIGGEARYTYRSNDMQVSSGSTKATAGAQSHAVHYDVLVHAASSEASVRPFAAIGAGMKYYRGTGTEDYVPAAQQPRGPDAHERGPAADQRGRWSQVPIIQPNAVALRFSRLHDPVSQQLAGPARKQPRQRMGSRLCVDGRHQRAVLDPTLGAAVRSHFICLTLVLGAAWQPARAQSVNGVRVCSDYQTARFRVDGAMYVGSATFLWPQGSKHFIEAVEPQDSAAEWGARYEYRGWANNLGDSASPGTSSANRLRPMRH